MFKLSLANFKLSLANFKLRLANFYCCKWPMTKSQVIFWCKQIEHHNHALNLAVIHCGAIPEVFMQSTSLLCQPTNNKIDRS